MSSSKSSLKLESEGGGDRRIATTKQRVGELGTAAIWISFPLHADGGLERSDAYGRFIGEDCAAGYRLSDCPSGGRMADGDLKKLVSFKQQIASDVDGQIGKRFALWIGDVPRDGGSGTGIVGFARIKDGVPGGIVKTLRPHTVDFQKVFAGGQSQFAEDGSGVV